MEKYRLLERKTVQPNGSLTVNENDADSSSVISHANELRITQQGKPRNYISHAMNLLTAKKTDGDGSEPATDTIVLKAMGRAVNKSVTIAEILKRKIPLHQITDLSTCEIIDVYEPLEEGLDVVEAKRFISCMMITLSLNPLDTTNIGYQPPLPSEEMQPGETHSM